MRESVLTVTKQPTSDRQTVILAFRHFVTWGGGRRDSARGHGVCLPLAAPIGLSPLYISTLRGSERVLVVSTEPLDDLSCLTTPGVGCTGDGLLPVLLTRCIQMHTPSPCWVCRVQH